MPEPILYHTNTNTNTMVFGMVLVYEGSGKKNPDTLPQARNLLAMTTTTSENALINMREINK